MQSAASPTRPTGSTVSSTIGSTTAVISLAADPLRIEAVGLLREVHHDCAGLEDADHRPAVSRRMVYERRHAIAGGDFRNSGSNWSPLPMLQGTKLYGIPSSSSRIVTFFPFGVGQ